MRRIIENTLFAFLIFVLLSIPSIYIIFLLLGGLLSTLSPFVKEFEIVNATGQYIWVTPVCKLDSDGRYCPLGTYYQRLSSQKKIRNVFDVKIKAGESIRIFYDWDDIDFRHILVKTAFGDIYIIDANEQGNSASCDESQDESQKDKFIISDLSTLSIASPELFPLLKDQCVKYSGAKEYDRDDCAIAPCNIPYHDPVRETCGFFPD